MSCNHQFIGHARGVTCKICGLSMTPDEYRAFIMPEKPARAVEPTPEVKKPASTKKPAQRKK